ncbi:MAG: Zn-dependent oligopeptidase [Polyangiaceae bacterium]|nr:Zn-dependent oligopeptidase [Polyangiaceae bacterium]
MANDGSISRQPSLSDLDAPGFDPVAAGFTAADILRFSASHLERARRLVESVRVLARAPDAALVYASVLAPLDEVAFATALAGGFAGLMEETHPDGAVREAARACRPRLVTFQTDMMLDAELADVVRRFSTSAAAAELTGTSQRLLKELLREFRRNGLELPPADQVRLRELNDELNRAAQDFSKNLAEATGSVRVSPVRLRGLPDAFLAAHPPEADGLVTITTDYPDYFPVVCYAEDRELARELNSIFDSRAAAENVPLLERVLALRADKARLLGYATWADYVLESRMARTPDAVRDFLAGAAAAVREPGRREYAEFQAERSLALGVPEGLPIPVYDRLYLEQRLREKKYGYDGKALSEYFPVEGVVSGVLGLVSRLFGLEFVPRPEAPRWHADVRVLDLLRGGVVAGRLFLDLFPREAKYKHAAMFEIRPGKRLADGTYATPMTALVTNFPAPDAGPALLTLEDVTTFFHELGHALHHLLTQEELASYSGTSTAQDFVETPSQMLEEWAFQREVLDAFARHYVTGAAVPEPLFAAMLRARAFGRALATERQLALAALDFEYHTQPTPLATDVVFREVMARTQQFAHQPETRFQATFGHLMGYDAGYYGYQWALAIARDVLTRFEREGFMSRATAADWLEQVLSRGGGADEATLVQAFLGRPTNLEAYAAFLRGEAATQ